MSCCCTKILKICAKVGTCEDSTLNLAYQAPAGDYIFQLDFLNAVINKAITVDDDGIVTLSTAGLNECFTYTGKLLDSDGNVVSITSAGIPYDCVSFTTSQLNND